MTMYYAAVKWPVGATPDEISRTLPNDLEILAMQLVQEHGFSFDRVSGWFENAVTVCEWCLSESTAADE